MNLQRHIASFASWWKPVTIEVDAALPPAASTGIPIDGESAAAVTPGFDGEHPLVSAVLANDGMGLEFELAY